MCVLVSAAKSRSANCYRQTEQPDWLQSIELLLLLSSIRASWPVGFGHSRTDAALLFYHSLSPERALLRSRVNRDLCGRSLCNPTKTIHWLYSAADLLDSGHRSSLLQIDSLSLSATCRLLSTEFTQRNANSPSSRKPFVPIRCPNCKSKSQLNKEQILASSVLPLLANSFANAAFSLHCLLSLHFHHHFQQFFSLRL